MATVSRTVSYLIVAGPHAGVTGGMDLTYDTAKPFDVTIDFGHGCTPWTVWRAVLAGHIDGKATCHVDGGIASAGFGYEVDGIWGYLTLAGWTDGKPHTVVLKALAAHIFAFLAVTAQHVPYNAGDVDVDAVLDALLKDGAR